MTNLTIRNLNLFITYDDNDDPAVAINIGDIFIVIKSGKDWRNKDVFTMDKYKLVEVLSDTKISILPVTKDIDELPLTKDINNFSNSFISLEKSPVISVPERHYIPPTKDGLSITMVQFLQNKSPEEYAKWSQPNSKIGLGGKRTKRTKRKNRKNRSIRK